MKNCKIIIPHFVLILLILFLYSIAFADSVLKDHFIYGTVAVSDEILSGSDVNYDVILKVDGNELVRWKMGSNGPNDPYYYFKVPLNNPLGDYGSFYVYDADSMREVPATIYDASETSLDENILPLIPGKMEQINIRVSFDDPDGDGDGIPDNRDLCPNDPNKVEPGACGCGVADTDSDGDGIPDCTDNCPNDPDKMEPGACGCGVADTDSDGDGTPDCTDNCPNDPDKMEPGACGCGVADTDSDGDGTPDCTDNCPNDPDKMEPGACGCGVADTDSDRDGIPDCTDNCPNDPDKMEPGACGCGVADTDSDGDGTPDCTDNCLNDPDKVDPGAWGCGVADMGSGGDGTPDCQESPPVANDDSYTTKEDTTLKAGQGGVLNNDIDLDNDVLSAVLVTEPDYGTLILDSDGSFEYTPNENFNGDDSFTYLANDGLEDSGTATVAIKVDPVNDVPDANAGPDKADVSIGEIPLVGSGTDIDGDGLTFSWSIISGPYDDGAELKDAASLSSSLVIGDYGTYEVELAVCDGEECGYDTAVITTAANLSPVANAGEDQTANQYDVVWLEGSGTDPNNDDINGYEWSITTQPDESVAALDNPSSATPYFTADLSGVYGVQLVVLDQNGMKSEPDTVTVTVGENSKPVAVIEVVGGNHSVAVGNEVCLDGNKSHDLDGDDRTCSWAIIHRPDGSAADLDATDVASPCFAPDVPGDYLVQLIVTDEHGLKSDPQTAMITGEGVGGAVKGDLDGDGDVDGDDLIRFREALFKCEGAAGYNKDADYDEDNCVTYADYKIWYGYYRNQ